MQWLCELQTILFLIYKILLIVILQTSYITFLSFLPKLKPGVPFSTTSVEIPLGPDKMNEVRRGKLIFILKNEMSNGEKKIAIGTWQAYIGEDDHGKLLLICSLCSKNFCTSLLFRFFCSCCNFQAITWLETLATQANWFVKYIPCSPVLTITTYTSVSPPPLMNALLEKTVRITHYIFHLLY